MRIYLEARQPDNQGNPVKVLALDETDHSEADRQADLADAHILFPAAAFSWHECCHDEDRPCARTEIA